MSDLYQQLSVPTTGGDLCIGRWGDGKQIVFASHGITANHLSWQRVGELVVEQSDNTVSLVAVDHRGRAGSAGVAGPFGLATHGNDMITLADYFDVDSAVLVGHSMGGFVVASAAEAAPDRVQRLVLVDGGVPFEGEIPSDANPEEIIRAVIGPALDRLDQRWPSEEDYVNFFRQHPAFLPPNEWPSAADAYVRHDAVVTAEGEVRSSVVKDAVIADGSAAIVDPASAAAIERVPTNTLWLWAPRGLLDQTPGLYSPEYVAATSDRLPHVTPQLVADTNHYTIAVGETGAQAVVAAVLGSR